MDSIKHSDQIAMLTACLKFTDEGTDIRIFSYPNCGWDLVQSGLVTQDCKVTTPGRAALYLLGLAPNPFPESKSSISFSLPAPEGS